MWRIVYCTYSISDGSISHGLELIRTFQNEWNPLKKAGLCDYWGRVIFLTMESFVNPFSCHPNNLNFKKREFLPASNGSQKVLTILLNNLLKSKKYNLF